MTQIILSIKPEYAEKILKKEKKYEFRKERIDNRNLIVIMYATDPVRKLVGYFYVSKIHKDLPRNLWKRFGNEGGIEKGKFEKYYKDNKIGFALQIGKVCKFKNPVDPFLLLHQFKPPQSFKYLNSQEITKFTQIFPNVKKLTDYL